MSHRLTCAFVTSGNANKMQVPQVDDHACTLPGNEDRVALVDCIGKENQTAADTEVPELNRNNAPLCALTVQPLHKEPHEEHALSQKSDDQPKGITHVLLGLSASNRAVTGGRLPIEIKASYKGISSCEQKNHEGAGRNRPG